MHVVSRSFLRIWGLGALTFCLTASPLLLSSGADAGASPLSASALMALALKDAVAQGSVHEVELATAPGHSFSMVDDIAAASGRQIINSDGAHAEVLVVKDVAYIYGDKKAVADYFQISTTDPGKYANRWLSIQSTNSAYATVTNAVTIKSDFTDVTIPGTVTRGASTVLNGQQVVPIKGSAPATATSAKINATLFVTTSSPVLPVELRLISKSETVTATWTKWGHRVTLSAPATSTPLA
jgi:hypothetical protein